MLMKKKPRRKSKKTAVVTPPGGSIKSYNVNYRWFQSVLRDRGMSQRALARLMHLDPSAVHHMLHGRRNIQLDEAVELARILEVPIEDVLTNAGIEPAPAVHGKGERVPVVAWIDGESVLSYDLSTHKGPRSVDPPPDRPAAGLHAIRCHTAMSRLEMLDGAVLYVPVSPSEALHECMGRWCIVTVVDEPLSRLRMPKAGAARGSFDLYEITGAPAEQGVWLEAIRPVLWVKLAG